MGASRLAISPGQAARWGAVMGARKYCRIVGCGTPVPVRKNFCAPHWAMVPPVMKENIVITYARGDGFELMLRESQLAVEEYLRDAAPRLHG